MIQLQVISQVRTIILKLETIALTLNNTKLAAVHNLSNSLNTVYNITPGSIAGNTQDAASVSDIVLFTWDDPNSNQKTEEKISFCNCFPRFFI